MNFHMFAKILFYVLVLINNIIALVLIGISFLSGPSATGEGAEKNTEALIFFRHMFYGIIVSLIFAATSLLIGYLFKKTLNFSREALLKLFVGVFALLLFVFLIVYCIVFFGLFRTN
jgi:hypothetical protein